jgi:hypothetical protein
MQRRDLLRSAAHTAAALVLLPRAASAEVVWQRVHALAQPAAQASLVASLADTLLPRTDTPGANDVNVSAFVDVIVAEYYTDAERTAFQEGLVAIDGLAQRMAGAPFAALTAAQRVPVMNALDQPIDRETPEARTYSRLKGLIIHAYFTSERVQREVLEYDIMPGRFDGSAPLRVRARAGSNGR